MSSSLRENLNSIQLKPYQPIYSAKIIKHEALLKKRQQNRSKTASEMSRTTSRLTAVNNYFASPSRNNFSVSSAASRLSEASDKATRHLDKMSVVSTNLSLLSLESDQTLPFFKTYGQFDYFSYFEKYMNIRSKFKIPRELMPEQPTEQEVSQLIRDDLFNSFELKSLDKLYDILKARPCKIRSNSVCCHNSIEAHEKTRISNSLKRLASVECFDMDYIDKKFEVTKRLNERNRKPEISDYEYRKNLLATFETEHDNIFPTFYARDIKYPRIYEWGARKKKKNAQTDDSNNEDQFKTNLYADVESKLASYIRPKRRKILDSLYEKRSKTALSLHKFASAPYVNYSKNTKESTNSSLKLSSNLDSLIRAEIRKNNGPIYFGEFNEENVESFSKITTVKLNNKFLNIYEWLSQIKVEECDHFLNNPFTSDTGINTEISNYNPEPSYNWFKNEKSKMDILNTKKFTIDPLQNIKNNNMNENQLPKKKLRSNMGNESIVETHDKQVLAVTKDYEKNFNLKLTNDCNKNKDRYITSRERLKKQLALNDVLMTRMTLDLFCL